MKYNQIKKILKEQRRTQTWLAEQLDKHQTSVSRWCANTDQPSLINLHKVAEVLEVSTKDLIPDQPKEE